MLSFELLKYDQFSVAVTGRKHLLLGNGFSIACDPIFKYPNLFEFAKAGGLSQEAQRTFEYLGTNNFEGVMRLLEDAHWMAKNYALQPPKNGISSMKMDLGAIKKALIRALTETHLGYPGAILEERKDRCVAFLEPYHNVFTTNYDLLLYWVNMHDRQETKREDGFRAPTSEPDSDHLEFQEHVRDKKGIFFLHGALHLYASDGEVCKHSWTRTDTRLIELVKQGLKKRQYPLFVAEGKAHNKLSQIEHSSYLSYCLGKLRRIEQTLVVYGHSLSPADDHIAEAIAEAGRLENLYVGLHGDPQSPGNKAIRQAALKIENQRANLFTHNKAQKALKVFFYDSNSVAVWDSVRTNNDEPEKQAA